MLERIDEVDWSQLNHAYGKATDVPELLRALAFGDAEARRNSLSEFFGNIWHQGTVYPATSRVVPFLIELLEERSVQDKDGILQLLAAVSGGSSYLDVHSRFADFYYHERRTTEFATRRAQELADVRSAHEAVISGVPTYLKLLSDTDPKVRAAVPYVLSTCAEARSEIDQMLRSHFDCESDAGVQAAIVLGIGALWQATGPTSEQSSTPIHRMFYLRVLGDTGRSLLPRVCAAIVLLRLNYEPALTESVRVARAALADCSDSFEALPFGEGYDLFTVVSETLMPFVPAGLEWLRDSLKDSDGKWRKRAIDMLHEYCRTERWVAADAAPMLAELADDPDQGVSDLAISTLGQIGSAGLEPLQKLSRHPNSSVREAAVRSLAQLQESRASYSTIDRWEKRPKRWWHRSVPRLLSLIRRLQASRMWDDNRAVQSAIIELGSHGPKAIAAVATLRELLDHEDQWIRVHSARALWRIGQDPDLVLPTLIKELQCAPTGFLVVDCLADIGPRAAPALRNLICAIESDRRLPVTGTLNDWCAQDEAFRELCAAAVARIRGCS